MMGDPPSGPFSRFIFSSSQVKRSGRVLTAAFLPPSKDPTMTSVAMHDGRSNEEVWSDGLAIECASTDPNRHLRGRAIAEVATATSATLSVERDETPPNRPHHANLVGWASEYEKRLAQAATLAANARGELWNRPNIKSDLPTPAESEPKT